MVDNYADLSGEPLNWGWMMRKIAEQGLTNRMGKPPPLGTAKRTWFRVVATMRAHPLPKSQFQPEATSTPKIQQPAAPVFAFATIKKKE